MIFIKPHNALQEATPREYDEITSSHFMPHYSYHQN
jgi:hypothetical protein